MVVHRPRYVSARGYDLKRFAASDCDFSKTCWINALQAGTVRVQSTLR